MEGTLEIVDDRSVLRFERPLEHPVEVVWEALTEPERLAAWFPARVELDLAPGGLMSFTFPDPEIETPDGRITQLDPPRVFAFAWGFDLMRFELRPGRGDCSLVFTHTFDQHDEAAKFAAGWHFCLDSLESLLAGEPPPGLDERWPQLHEGYVRRFA